MKLWKKPTVLELTAEQLSAYIEAAAGTICFGTDFR